MAVDHPGLRPGQRDVGAGPADLERDRGRAPGTAGLHVGDRDERLARCDAGEEFLLCRFIGAGLEGVGGEHGRREEGRAEERSTHFLHHHQELYVPHPRAAMRFGDDQAGEPDLFGHLRPDTGVVAPLARHVFAHRRLGRTLLEEGAHRGAEFVVFVREAEVECHLSLLRARGGSVGRVPVRYGRLRSRSDQERPRV